MRRHFLMELGAFISLEDISCDLPTYTEEVIGVEMDPPLRTAYRQLEEDVKRALKEHRGNHSVMSVGLNALWVFPDRLLSERFFRMSELIGSGVL